MCGFYRQDSPDEPPIEKAEVELPPLTDLGQSLNLRFGRGRKSYILDSHHPLIKAAVPAFPKEDEEVAQLHKLMDLLKLLQSKQDFSIPSQPPILLTRPTH